MTPLNFRAWNKIRKTMILWDEIIDSHDDDLLYRILQPTIFNGFIPMQSTGLTDKNGKEIFEGDVVCIPYDDNLREVVWPEKYFCDNERNEDLLAWCFDNPNLPLQGIDVQCVSSYEVIGNVWENPDLLK